MYYNTSMEQDVTYQQPTNKAGQTISSLSLVFLALLLIVGIGYLAYSLGKKQTNLDSNQALTNQMLQQELNNQPNTPNLPEALPPQAEPTCTICEELPVVVYTPGGLFTGAEKTQSKIDW